jgi:polyisoprenoid-binding protein YceI
MIRFLALFFLAIYPFSSFAETYDLSKIQSSVEWFAVGNPGFLKIESKSQTLSGNLSISDSNVSGNFSSSLDKISTGIKLRDEHIKDTYLEIKKYPEAKFSLNATNLYPVFKATGTMFLHGVEHGMTWDCQFAKSSEVKKISCLSKIVLTDFNIKIPSYLGVTVAKDVKVKVTMVL